MGNYENLKQSITEVIRTNGNKEITGAVLQSTLLTIISTVGANATFSGIATPTTNPGTPDGPVFYLASESGTYTNFNAIELQDGLSVLLWNGTWSSQQVFSVDNEPTAGSDNLVKSGGVAEELALGAVYDVSAKNPTAGVNNDGKWESLSALLSDANLNTLIPTAVRKGGMSIKFVQSSDNKYVQYLLIKNEWSLNETDWEKVNIEEDVSQLEQKVSRIENNNTDDETEEFSIKNDSETETLLSVTNEGVNGKNLKSNGVPVLTTETGASKEELAQKQNKVEQLETHDTDDETEEVVFANDDESVAFAKIKQNGIFANNIERLINGNVNTYNKIEGYVIDNLGYKHAVSGGTIYLLPIIPNTKYTLFTQKSYTGLKIAIFDDSNGVNNSTYNVVDASTQEPDLEGDSFSYKPFHYGNHFFIKTPNNSYAKYIALSGIAEEDIDNIRLYKGVIYRNLNRRNIIAYNNSRINALLIGDSFWESYDGAPANNVLSNYLKTNIGITKIMNFAQGGGRLIHSSNTVDVTSYDESYENGSPMNVYSNQFLKWKFRHEEDPVSYPIPDVIFICGTINNTAFYPSKFDSNNYSSVWSKNNVEAADEMLFSGAYRALIKRITDTVGYDIPLYNIFTPQHPDTDATTYLINKEFEVAASAHGVRVVDPMKRGGLNYMNSSVWRDDTHPNETGAKILADVVSEILINDYNWQDCRMN